MIDAGAAELVVGAVGIIGAPLVGWLLKVAKSDRDKLSRLLSGQESVERRLLEVDKRFDSGERRFAAIDRRLDDQDGDMHSVQVAQARIERGMEDQNKTLETIQRGVDLLLKDAITRGRPAGGA